MKLFIVLGIYYHESTEILGVYDDMRLAEEKLSKEKSIKYTFDNIRIKEIELNKDIDDF